MEPWTREQMGYERIAQMEASGTTIMERSPYMPEPGLEELQYYPAAQEYYERTYGPIPAPLPPRTYIPPPTAPTPLPIRPIPLPVVPAGLLPTGGLGLPTVDPGSPIGELLSGWGVEGWPLGETAAATGGTVVEAGLPAIGAAGITLGAAKALLAKFGPTILKAILGAGVFAGFMKLLGIGAPDTTLVKSVSTGKRRYSIGGNPRLNTLLKVAKRVDNIFASYDSRISKFRSRIKGPQRRRANYYPMTKFLSPVERKQLTRGRG